MNALTVSADFAVATLSLWLGAVVVTRAGLRREARVFGVLALLLALWGTSRVVEDLTASGAVRHAAGGVEITVAPFLIAVMLHFALVLAGGARRALWVILCVAYIAAAAVWLLTLTDRSGSIAIRPPYRAVFGIRSPAIGGAWILFRVALVILAIGWVWRAWRAAGHQGARREQLTALLGAVGCAGAGGVVTILLAETGAPEWPGVTLIAAGAGLATYAVFAGQLFQPAGAARRSFGVSLATGVLTALYVALLLGAERVARGVLATNTPIVTALALVLTIACFDPVRERVRSLVDRRTERQDRTYAVLLGAIGGELLTATRPRDAVAPALTQLCRALGLRAATVTDTEGNAIAVYGMRTGPDAAPALTLPLRAGQHHVGTLIVGAKRNHLPYTSSETARLNLAASYIATSLHVDDRLTAQATALDALTAERAALGAQEAALAVALAESPAPLPPTSVELRVWALGPLRVERNGERIGRWGGAKAGTRQAEAMFAFLFDRAERGVAKDEFLEVIWPDIPLDKADLAFHRTLGGLRRMLEPALTRGREATTITFGNDRYRLDPTTIAWSDARAFEEGIAAASRAGDDAETLAALDAARALYRGDYLDDCPFYGDSEYVEERRDLLRGRHVDVLVALGERYERKGDVPAAAACFREALHTSGDALPRAEAGLARLGVAV